jgi:hypothetical protein
MNYRANIVTGLLVLLTAQGCKAESNTITIISRNSGSLQWTVQPEKSDANPIDWSNWQRGDQWPQLSLAPKILAGQPKSELGGLPAVVLTRETITGGAGGDNSFRALIRSVYFVNSFDCQVISDDVQIDGRRFVAIRRVQPFMKNPKDGRNPCLVNPGAGFVHFLRKASTSGFDAVLECTPQTCTLRKDRLGWIVKIILPITLKERLHEIEKNTEAYLVSITKNITILTQP